MVDFHNLIEYCKSGDLKGVKYLYSLGCDPKARNNEAIRWASNNGHLEVVKYLVSLGCDPKASDNCAIRRASNNGHLEVVKYLFSIGCDPKACDNSTIRWTSVNGYLDVVKYLFEQGCDHKNVEKDIKYEVLQEYKIKLLIMLNGMVGNKYLQMEILKKWFPSFTEYEIMSLL